MLYIEIDDDDGNDILNYSGTTESYSVPTDHDSDKTVDYRDAVISLLVICSVIFPVVTCIATSES